jgi:O-antigen/teichoic acid export membrane protein
LAKPLVVFFYGVEYLAAIPLVFILAIFAVLSGLEVGIGPIFRTLNRIDLTIRTNTALIILEVILIFILAKLFGLIGLAWAVTIIFVLVPLINFLLAWTLLNKQVRNEI